MQAENREMSTGEALEWLGRGHGEGARRRFVRYVERREKTLGVKIFIRQKGGARRITPSLIREHLPELLRSKIQRTADQVRHHLAEFDAKFDARVDSRIEQNPVVRGHTTELEQLYLLVEQVAQRLNKAS